MERYRGSEDPPGEIFVSSSIDHFPAFLPSSAAPCNPAISGEPGEQHEHGLIKRVGRTYKYYLTRLGRQVILTGLKLRELVVIPELALPSH